MCVCERERERERERESNVMTSWYDQIRLTVMAHMVSVLMVSVRV